MKLMKSVNRLHKFMFSCTRALLENIARAPRRGYAFLCVPVSYSTHLCVRGGGTHASALEQESKVCGCRSAYDAMHFNDFLMEAMVNKCDGRAGALRTS